jgi:hypothetical protein
VVKMQKDKSFTDNRYKKTALKGVRFILLPLH